MTDLRQAAQQALECIERLNAHGWILADFEDEVYAAITALRTALEQQAEPTCPECKAKVLFECVACSSNNYPPQQQAETPPEWPLVKNILDEYGLDGISFVAEWKAAQQQAEPVAYYHPRNGFYWAKPTSIFAPTVVDVPPMPLYTSPQRTWVGLTKDEIEILAYKAEGNTWKAVELAEAKLKELNT